MNNLNTLYTEQLMQSGLTNEQAVIYETLIKLGQLPASKISLKTTIKRGMVYKTLEQLIEMKLVEKIENKEQTTIFRPNHPSKLEDLVESNLQKINQTKSAVESILGNMTSDFNLLSGKPNIRFYEGMKGVEEVLNDSLKSKEKIYTFADIEAIQKYIPEINEKYVAKRDRIGIEKQALILDTEFARNFLKDYHKETTDIKLIKHNAPPFQTVMQIYDNKISYLTLSEDEMIGVIIEDKHIYRTHKYIFEYIWSITT